MSGDFSTEEVQECGANEAGELTKEEVRMLTRRNIKAMAAAQLEALQGLANLLEDALELAVAGERGRGSSVDTLISTLPKWKPDGTLIQRTRLSIPKRLASRTKR